MLRYQIEEKIDSLLRLFSRDNILTTNKRKSASQFNQQLFDILDKSTLQLGFSVSLCKPLNRKYIRILRQLLREIAVWRRQSNGKVCLCATLAAI